MAGKAAHEAETMDREIILAKVMKVLINRFGKIPNPVKYLVTHWKEDESDF